MSTLFFCEQETGPIPIQLADAFGLFIQCRDMIGERALLAQVIHTLQEAVKPEKPLYTSCWNFSTDEYIEVHILCSHFLCIVFHKIHCLDFSLYVFNLENLHHTVSLRNSFMFVFVFLH